MDDNKIIIIASSLEAAKTSMADHNLEPQDVRIVTQEFSLVGLRLVQGRYIIAEKPGIISPRMWRKIETMKKKAASV